MADQVKIGLDCKAYYGTAGSSAATEMTNIQDVTLTLEKTEADVTTRGANGWELSRAVLKKASIQFKMQHLETDAAFIAMKSAFFNDTAIALKFLDGEGGSGLDADFDVITFTRNEPLKEAVTYDVTVKPTLTDRSPSWA